MGDYILEVKGLLRREDANKLKAITSSKPIIDNDGNEYKNLIVVGLCTESEVLSYDNWRFKRTTKTDNWAGKSLGQWCFKYDIDYLPVAPKNTMYLKQWLQKQGQSSLSISKQMGSKPGGIKM